MKPVTRSRSMNKALLYLLKDIGLLDEVPETMPAQGTVLARGVCFLHDGADNPNAFLLFADGFVCTTHECHRTWDFGHNLEGLIRLMVHRVTGKNMAWRDAWWFARTNRGPLRELVAERVRHAKASRSHRTIDWSLEDLTACLQIPDPYYLRRGYRPETLEYFHVGTCVRPLPDGNEKLLGWSIIPVVERSHLPPLGYTARNPRWVEGGLSPKWIHGVTKSECLFNADKPARGPLIICEGPGCVMRFYEAGLPGAVATLGASLSECQYYWLVSLLHNQKVFVAGDADETGRRFAETVKSKLKGVCDPIIIYPPHGKDCGDLSTEDIQSMQLK